MFSKLWLVYQIQQPSTTECRFSARGHSFIQKMTDFCTKMKFSPFYMIFRGTGAGQHYFVAFLSLLSPQARGASVVHLICQWMQDGQSFAIFRPNHDKYILIYFQIDWKKTMFRTCTVYTRPEIAFVRGLLRLAILSVHKKAEGHGISPNCTNHINANT